MRCFMKKHIWLKFNAVKIHKNTYFKTHLVRPEEWFLKSIVTVLDKKFEDYIYGNH